MYIVKSSKLRRHVTPSVVTLSVITLSDVTSTLVTTGSFATFGQLKTMNMTHEKRITMHTR